MNNPVDKDTVSAIDSLDSAAAGTGGEKQSTAATSGTNTREVSVATIGRMLGLATSAEIEIFESKIDAVTTKMALLTSKLEKLATLANSFPSGSDLERIDIQISGLKGFIQELLSTAGGTTGGTTAAKSGATEIPDNKKPRSNVFVSAGSTENQKG